jgi:hypothetical protein
MTELVGAVFGSLEAFYDRRGGARSGELDFGVHWTGLLRWPAYRVSVVHETGDVYAHDPRGPVTVLARLEALRAPVHDSSGRGICAGFGCPYLEAERILRGWADWCGRDSSLSWIRQRLRLASEGNL